MINLSISIRIDALHLFSSQPKRSVLKILILVQVSVVVTGFVSSIQFARNGCSNADMNSDSMNDQELNVTYDQHGTHMQGVEDVTGRPPYLTGVEHEVMDCKARIKIRAIKDKSTFELYDFVEEHNHGLIHKENLDLSFKRRKLNFSDQEYIAKCRLANVGPTKAHRLQVALKGGHHMVRGTNTYYKNFGRDVSTFIGNKDAQMFMGRMPERSKHMENFTFEYHTIDFEVRGVWNSNIPNAIHELVWNVYLKPFIFESRWKLLVALPPVRS
ncbi:hypothetical protein E3N88_15781 [Mikania micrantha]|uniref:Protein FAR1-RELATED SEQUENCE n=1 Tax=Mikania micrantha TaxID=192012 RepID=A0A5N6NY73_9ASTR|nr:hypothetical protein E3N88_15781 [Mikania micrantha]